jgi:hypothetical protein
LGEREAATRDLKGYLMARKADEKDDWNGKIGAFLAGTFPEKDLLEAATTDVKRSQAFFAVAVTRGLSGNKRAAEDFYKKVVDLHQKLSFEYPSALAELETLKQGK